MGVRLRGGIRGKGVDRICGDDVDGWCEVFEGEGRYGYEAGPRDLGLGIFWFGKGRKTSKLQLAGSIKGNLSFSISFYASLV